MIERVSGMSLNDYFQKYILQPLDIKNINMFPTEQMKRDLARMHAKAPDGNIREREHALRRPLMVEGKDVAGVFNSAGAGCFARPIEYCGEEPRTRRSP